MKIFMQEELKIMKLKDMLFFQETKKDGFSR